MINSKKTILFVGLDYHHYTTAILDEIQRQGHLVDYIDIQPRNFLFKTFKTLSGKAYQAYLERYHRTAFEKAASKKYDQVLFLQAHQVSPENLTYLQQSQQGAEFTLYNWDALSNHNYLSRAQFFDRVLTFDPDDAAAHGFEYLPLFCIRTIQALRHDQSRARSVFMIGNIVNVDRYHAVQKFAAYAQENNIDFTTYLVASPVVITRMLLKRIWPKGLHLKFISPKIFGEMTEQSLAVFDFANHQQSGYTMRTVENLCAGKKIITNNPLILEDYFYSADRILCFDGFDFSKVGAFLETSLVHPDRHFEELYVQAFTQQFLAADAPKFMDRAK